MRDYTPPIMTSETGKERFSTFPQFSFEAGGITGPRLKSELAQLHLYRSDWADDLLDRLQHPDIKEHITTVKFRLSDVGIRDYVNGMNSWNKVVRAVEKDGIDLCPQLTAAEMARLNAGIIGEGEYADILSKPIIGGHGYPSLFALKRLHGKLELNGGINYGWNPDNLVVGRLR